MNEQPTGFMGTYFEKSAVLRVSRWGEIFAYVVGVIYAIDLATALGVFYLQYARGFWAGLGFSDLFTNLLYIIERPFRGMVYYILLMAISKGLLILMDIEDNLRHAARKSTK